MEKENELQEALELLEQEKNRTQVLKSQLKKARIEIADYKAEKAQKDTDAMFDLIRKNAAIANEMALRSAQERREASRAREEAERAIIKALISALIASLVFASSAAFVILEQPQGAFLGAIMLIVFLGGCIAQKSFSCIQSFFGGFKK